jgi:hypothetical protein
MATESSGIQLRFLRTFETEMSLDIRKSTDFYGLFHGTDFVRLFI